MASLTMKTRQNLAKEDSALVRQMRQIMANPEGQRRETLNIKARASSISPYSMKQPKMRHLLVREFDLPRKMQLAFCDAKIG